MTSPSPAGTGLLAPDPDGTASRGTRILGAVIVVATVAFLFVALVGSPPDRSANDPMGELVRIMYVHVPAAIACYTAFLVTAVLGLIVKLAGVELPETVWPVARLESSLASLTRCASPPESVVACWPSLM